MLLLLFEMSKHLANHCAWDSTRISRCILSSCLKTVNLQFSLKIAVVVTTSNFLRKTQTSSGSAAMQIQMNQFSQVQTRWQRIDIANRDRNLIDLHFRLCWSSGLMVVWLAKASKQLSLQCQVWNRKNDERWAIIYDFPLKLLMLPWLSPMNAKTSSCLQTLLELSQVQDIPTTTPLWWTIAPGPFDCLRAKGSNSR